MNINMEIMVVGAGGTGGNYIKELARFIYSLPKNEQERIGISIIDGDAVEERNIARQPFTRYDVGENKAVAMCNAVQEVFGLQRVTAFPHYIESMEQMDHCWYMQEESADYVWKWNRTLYVIVGCVDNHHARKIMHGYFMKPPKDKPYLVYIDSANEESVGEVVIACRSGKKIIAPTRKYYYPNIFRGKLKSAREKSCLEMNEIAPQHLVTNMLAANILLNQTTALFKGKVEGGIVFFDAMQSMMRTVPYQEA